MLIGGVNIKTGKRYYRGKGQKKRGAGKTVKFYKSHL